MLNNGQDLLDMLKNILGGEGISNAFALQLINLARIRIEAQRPWKVLSTVDSTQIVSPATTYTTPITVPANFVRYLGESSLAEGSVVLFDGNTDVEYITEIPIENILSYKDQYSFCAVDYGSNLLYFTGLIPKQYNVYQYYIADYGDITLATGWNKFPKRFWAILAFDAAAHWRLGTDYDDVASRNANDNYLMAQQIMTAMSKWDAELAISSVNALQYRNRNNGNGQGQNGVGPRGVYAGY